MLILREKQQQQHSWPCVPVCCSLIPLLCLPVNISESSYSLLHFLSFCLEPTPVQLLPHPFTKAAQRHPGGPLFVVIFCGLLAALSQLVALSWRPFCTWFSCHDPRLVLLYPGHSHSSSPAGSPHYSFWRLEVLCHISLHLRVSLTITSSEVSLAPPSLHFQPLPILFLYNLSFPDVTYVIYLLYVWWH